MSPKHTPIDRKQVEILLSLDKDDFHKLIGDNPMPAWLLGEKIAQELRKGLKSIHLTVKETLYRYSL